MTTVTRRPEKLIPADFPTLPGLDALNRITVAAGSLADAEALGFIVHEDGDVPAELGMTREALIRAGFDAKVGSVLVIPTMIGPDIVAVGAGKAADLDSGTLRDVAAAFARSTSRRARICLTLTDTGSVTAGDAARAVTEGAVLARYRYAVLQAAPKDTPLAALGMQIPGTDGSDIGSAIAAAMVAARATIVARDLANTPAGHLTAADLGVVAESLGAQYGFTVELFDKRALIDLGCGGLLGVNRGSVEEPRMIKLSYRPPATPVGHLGMVGKGIMYDSGGISLKPSDPMHLLMKMDMGGAAAVLGAFTGLRDTGTAASVTGWLMCTDNMPSGTAYKLGDVLTARGGTTVEVKNTDAEGRLVMMDALVLANEDDVDAIVDIATLTGAALMALGQATAPVLGNDQAMIGRAVEAARVTDEPVWQLPLERKYRAQLNSDIADISNLGGKYAGATTAALFLEHFVGSTPWAHIDIAGTMQSDTDDAWRSKGATGFGARLLLELARRFSA